MGSITDYKRQLRQAREDGRISEKEYRRELTRVRMSARRGNALRQKYDTKTQIIVQQTTPEEPKAPAAASVTQTVQEDKPIFTATTVVEQKNPQSIYIPPSEQITVYETSPGQAAGYEDPIAQQSVLAPAGTTYSVSEIRTLEVDRAQAINKPIETLPEPKKADEPIKQTEDNSIVVDSGFGGRAENLVKNEEAVREIKEDLYGKIGIGVNPEDPWLVTQAKGIARAPGNIVEGLYSLSGRTLLAGETLIKSRQNPELLGFFGVPTSLKEANPFNKDSNPFLIKQVGKAVKSQFSTDNPDFVANVALTALMVKGAAGSAPSWVNKVSKRYVPIEEAGFNIRESVTQEFALPELLEQQGKTVTGVHTSFSDLFGKSTLEKLNPFKQKTETYVEAFPNQAKGFRKAIDQYSLYKSLPDKASGEPQAYGGYIGIFEDVSGSKPKTVFSIGEPKRYAYVFRDETISKLTAAEQAGIRQGGVKGARSIMEVQKQRTGSANLAAENLVGQSVEGQYVSPEGSLLRVVDKGKFTIYDKYSSSNPTLRKIADFTGIGKKSYKINIVEAETLPGKTPTTKTVPKPADLTPVRSVNVANASFASLGMKVIIPKSIAAKSQPANSLLEPVSESIVSQSSAAKVTISPAASNIQRSSYTKSKPEYKYSFGSTSRPSIPSIPLIPSTPSQPSRPSNPSIPSKPSDPSLPSIPSIPSKPSIPSIPSIPSQPSRPSIPSIPSISSDPSSPSKTSIPSLFSKPSKPMMRSLTSYSSKLSTPSVMPKLKSPLVPAGRLFKMPKSKQPPSTPGKGSKGKIKYRFSIIGKAKAFSTPRLKKGLLSGFEVRGL